MPAPSPTIVGRAACTRARIAWARSHALASVGAMIGRVDTLKRTSRPRRLASARTSATRSRTAASGSPHSAYTSQCLMPTTGAGPEAPPK